MMYDIAALQHMYGANYGGNNTQKFDGDTTYKWDPRTGEFFIEGASQWVPEQEGVLNRTGRIFQTIWDGNGVDTYDFSDFGTPVDVDLRPGHWSTVSEGRLADLGDQDAVGNIANAFLHRGDTRSLIEERDRWLELGYDHRQSGRQRASGQRGQRYAQRSGRQ